MSERQETPVQEIAKSCKNEVPERFIHKNGYPQAQVDFVPLMDNIVVDFSLLFDHSSSPESHHLELAKLQSALSQWGCFQATNHGLSSTFLDEVREVTKKFFDLPLEEKQKYSRVIDDYDGYGNDTIVSENQTLDWTDRLYLTVHLKISSSCNIGHRSLLHLDENCFLKEHGETVNMAGRFNYYPPCPTPQSVLGIKPHADGTTLTMLLQDKEVEGLQVLKDEQWFRVPVIPDALFINVGDLLEIMSNGILKSPVHRVVTNQDRERMSVAVFCFSDPNREVGPVAELISDEKPQMYKRVQHYQDIFFQYYQLGQRPLDAVRI
ncbi:hypothetical protein KSS87_003429 [Heliosperma pusillum]|nr:hypothetical protein KSS87_003429 [Heliosperma pusillum]